MGASASRITHDVVIKSTKDTRLLVGEIFRFMQREINLRDFYKLSVPAECDKYIVIMTNFLDTLFSRLQLVPIKNKSGILYFRKIEDFKKDDKIKSERYAGCLLLSYFYVRILQIYGALALTVIDESQQFTEAIEGQEYAPYTSRLALGFQRETVKGGAFGDEPFEYEAPPAIVPGIAYGAIPPTAAVPQIYGYPQMSGIQGQVIRSSVIPGQRITFKEEPLTILNGLGPKYKSAESRSLVFDNISKFFLKTTEMELNMFGKFPYTDNIQRKRSQELSQFLEIGYDLRTPLFQNSEAYLALELDKSETSVKTGKILLRIVPTTIGSENTPKEILMSIRIRGYTNDTGNSVNLEEESAEENKETQAQTGKIRIQISNVTISNSLLRNYAPKKLSQERFIIRREGAYKVQKFTNSFKLLPIDEYLKKIIYFILLDPKIIAVLYPTKFSKKEIEQIYKEAGVPPELDIAELLNILQKAKKPRPYCISRALQLLTTNPVNNEKYTNICVRNFSAFGVEQPLYEKSIPLPDNQLSNITSITTLDSLFKDTFEFVKAIGENSFHLEFRKSQSAIDTYKDFLSKMIQLFGTTTENTSSILQIYDARSSKKCSQSSLDNKVFINSEILKRMGTTVDTAVSKLFQTQINHTYKVGKILSRLFIRRKLPSGEIAIFLHPELLSKGFIQLQEINRDAYKILVDYYTNCETTYSQGQSAMIQAIRPTIINDSKQKINKIGEVVGTDEEKKRLDMIREEAQRKTIEQEKKRATELR